MNNLLSGKKLAFVYNVRHKYPDPKNPATFTETDFDDQETIDKIIEHLKFIGFDVLPVEANEYAEQILSSKKEEIGFAFNYSEVVLNSRPKIYMAQIFEKLKLPFSGSSNKTQKIIINKGKMKLALKNKGISTLPFQVIANSKEKLSKQLTYPVIIKPIAEGSSAGITNKSVVTTDVDLFKQIEFVIKTFKEPALVEPFIEGREFSIGMLGNPPEFLPIIEPKHAKLPKGYYAIDSLEVKWEFEEELGKDYFSCPAEVSPDLEQKIKNLCLKAWKALGIRDFCRIDLRMDDKGVLYILDVNSPPGMIPPEISETSYFPMAAKVKGYEYRELLVNVIQIGMKREGLI